MNTRLLPFDAPLAGYQEQAEELLDAYRLADTGALCLFHQKHPRFLDAEIPWLPKDISDAEIAAASLSLDDARLAIARWYDFRDWDALASFVGDVTRTGSPIGRFEAAVEAVIYGEFETLRKLLLGDPALIHARSTRITHFDPPVHRATMLHYIAANGVEGYRQKTPPNAVEIARALLEAGAEVDALAGFYGGGCTTMSLLVSSCHPAQAGLQPALVDLLVDFGASLEPAGHGKWTSPLATALVFGYKDAAETLVRRGARVDDLATAAGVGRTELVQQLLPNADADTRHRALALAAQMGYAAVVKLLIDAGENPDRYNPDGLHSHSTPLHQAALAGHEEVVCLLVQRGARRDMRDKIYNGTPLGWAEHGGHPELERYLRP